MQCIMVYYLEALASDVSSDPKLLRAAEVDCTESCVLFLISVSELQSWSKTYH